MYPGIPPHLHIEDGTWRLDNPKIFHFHFDEEQFPALCPACRQPLRLPIRSSNVMLSPERHRLQTFTMKRTAHCRTGTMHIKDGTRQLEKEIPLPSLRRLGITCEQFDSPRLLKLETWLKWLKFPPQADLPRVKASDLESGKQFLRQHPSLAVWGTALSH
jgi:hypothetical protein